MKALTLWQPWASLIAWGDKHYETRSWETTYRGPLAIHASLRDDTIALIECNSFYRAAFDRAGVSYELKLPAGCVLCIVNLVDIVKTESVKPRLSQSEEAFGDYSSGRFAWKLELVNVFREPIPARGYQQLWEWRRPLSVEPESCPGCAS